MTTAKQKVENWLDECGYVQGKSFCVYLFNNELHSINYVKADVFTTHRILCITNPDGTVHLPPADLHEDDKPEPVDKALQLVISQIDYDPNWREAFIEINSRLKSLEAKVG